MLSAIVSVRVLVRAADAATAGVVGSALPTTDGEPISGMQTRMGRLRCAMAAEHFDHVGTSLRRFLLSSTKRIDGCLTPRRICWRVCRSTDPLSTDHIRSGVGGPGIRVISTQCAKFPRSRFFMRWWSAPPVAARSTRRTEVASPRVWLHS